MAPVRVLVVDDSTFMRTLLTDQMSAFADIEVVGQARNGAQALTLLTELEPEVVLLDLEMPVMDGLTALHHIMAERPTPVVVFSAMDQTSAGIALRAMQMGAVDYIPKPTNLTEVENIIMELVDRILLAAHADVAKITSRLHPEAFKKFTAPDEPFTVVIGTSTGGPHALFELLPQLPRHLPARILVVQHMPPFFTTSLAERLQWQTPMEVREAEDGMVAQSGHIYIAPGDYHIRVVREGSRLQIHLDHSEKQNSVRPSVDVLARSVAREVQGPMIGILLTGMGRDGAVGMKEIRDAGGHVIVEDESTALVNGMPQAAIELGAASEVLPLDRIVPRLMELME